MQFIRSSGEDEYKLKDLFGFAENSYKLKKNFYKDINLEIISFQ